MYAFKKIMIALDLSQMDEYILSYAEGLCKVIEPKKIYFINIQKDLDLDKEERELLGFPSKKPMDEILEKELKKSIEKHFPSFEDYKTEVEVVEGKPSEKLLKWSKIKNADLLIMGRKKELSGEGIASQNVAPKVQSSILLVPEGVKTFKLNNVFVPVNFSKETTLALEEAIDMQEKTNQRLDINCHYVCELPLGFEKSGKSDDEFAEVLNKNASKKFRKLKVDIGKDAAQFDYSNEHLKDGNISEALNAKALELSSDLIIMGAKSKTLVARLFLGNTTKKMIINTSTIPLLVIKDKNNSFDFWDFFSKM